ncbi:MAG: 50S ribosome-binding GTPase [Planctomycetes bacterium]|nr:50S ribosome-binding GTPase [Planctomycetota bacterium]
MSTFAAVMTGQGTGAISTIQVFGDKSEVIIKEIFKPTGTKSVFKDGEILVGSINDGTETIDQVTIGCEGTKNYTINCHGNPLIVEMIMRLLGQHGVEPVTAEQLLIKILSMEESINTIAIEAKLAQTKTKTAEGAKIIANQIEGGLHKKATQWLSNINTLSLEEIAIEAEQILDRSQTAKLIMYGCTAVITGPPNSGKSTLLNQLAGKQKAIVTDIEGTTRDWVSSTCRMGSLCVELIDTAGLDEKPAVTTEDIEKDAQKRTVAILEKADLVLLVLDISGTTEQLNKGLVTKTAGKKVITILNKSDLPAKLDAGELPGEKVQLSAKTGDGVENLIKQIQQFHGADDSDLEQAVCFTSRQKQLLGKVKEAKSKEETTSAITELLNGQLSV